MFLRNINDNEEEWYTFEKKNIVILEELEKGNLHFIEHTTNANDDRKHDIGYYQNETSGDINLHILNNNNDAFNSGLHMDSVNKFN